MDRRRPEMGYWWYKHKKKLEPKLKINDLKCIECGRIIHRETLSAYEINLIWTYGAYCKNCMNKKIRSRLPWYKRKHI
jgi:hypothetical protein